MDIEFCDVRKINKYQKKKKHLLKKKLQKKTKKNWGRNKGM